MSDTPIIDAHMHIYPSREQGLRNKSTYTVWEYGEKVTAIVGLRLLMGRTG